MRKILILIVLMASFLCAQTLMQKEIEWRKQRYSELSGVDKDFFGCHFMSKQCTGTVKEYIERGLDKNLVVSRMGEKLMSYYANDAIGSTRNMEIARWLSSIGADSYGTTSMDKYVYAEPKVFENKHIKMIVKDVTWGGGKRLIYE